MGIISKQSAGFAISLHLFIAFRLETSTEISRFPTDHVIMNSNAISDRI
jgi:hypothetical protein